jgi:hypothetical protein
LTKTTAVGGGNCAQDLQDNVLTNDMHGLTAGKTYRFDVQLYTGAATPGNARFYILEYYGGGWNATLLGSCSSSGGWNHIQKTITLNQSTVAVRIYPWISTNEAINTLLYIDMFSLRLESRFTIDLNDAYAPEYAGIVNHNFSATAVIKFEMNTSLSWTSPAVSETMTWAEFLIFKELVNTTSYRYCSFVVYDPDNEDGYAEMGYLHAGNADSYNGVSQELPEAIDDKGIYVENDEGEVFGTDGAILHSWDIKIPDVYTATKTQLKTMINAVRKHTPFFWIGDEDSLTDFDVKWVHWTDYGFPTMAGFKLSTFSGTLKEAG